MRLVPAGIALLAVAGAFGCRESLSPPRDRVDISFARVRRRQTQLGSCT